MSISDLFSWSLVGWGLFSLVVYEVGWIVYCRTLHPLAKIPGPFTASFSRYWIVTTNNAADAVGSQKRLHAKYGYLVRVAPNMLSCSDPEALKTIYDRKGEFIKSDWYSVYSTDRIGSGGDHFSNRDDKSHTERRRVVNSLYSLSNVLKSEASIDRVIQLFMQRTGTFKEGYTPCLEGTFRFHHLTFGWQVNLPTRNSLLTSGTGSTISPSMLLENYISAICLALCGTERTTCIWLPPWTLSFRP